MRNVPDDRQSSGRYRHPFDTIPSRFFAVKYYDHMRTITLQQGVTDYHVEFPPMNENGIVTKWGFSIWDFTGGQPAEQSISVYQQFRISLMINDNAVPGYVGIEHSLNTPEEDVIIGAGLSLGTSVFSILHLVPVCFPIVQDQTPIAVDFINVGLDPLVHVIKARIVGVYNAP